MSFAHITPLTECRLRCDSTAGDCNRCTKAQVTCVRSPSLRRQRVPRSKRQARRISNNSLDNVQGTQSQLMNSYDDSSESRTSAEFEVPSLGAPEGAPPLGPPSTDVNHPQSGRDAIYPGFTQDGQAFRTPSSRSALHILTPEQDQADHIFIPEPISSGIGPDHSGKYSSSSAGGEHTARFPPFRCAPDVDCLLDVFQQLHDNAAKMTSCLSSLGFARHRSSVGARQCSIPFQPLHLFDSALAATVREVFELTQNVMELLNGTSGTPSIVARTPSEMHYSPLTLSPVEGGGARAHPTSEPRIFNAAFSPSAGARLTVNSQSARLLLLSCYLCLLETYEQLVQYIEAVGMCWATTHSTAASEQGLPVSSSAQGEATLTPLTRVLSQAYRLLDDIREGIRYSLPVWEGAINSHSESPDPDNDVMKPAVLATSVREWNLRNKISRLYQQLSMHSEHQTDDLTTQGVH